MAATAVRVALRVRPLTQKEQLSNCTECVSFIPNQPQILIGKDYSFTYDYVFDPRAQQRDIYNACVSPLVEKYVEGFNATILAYGQTGSGKTYSMGTAIDGNLESEENQGIVPRFISDLYFRLEQKKKTSNNFEYNVYVSFLELYNEDLVDLLSVQDFSHQRRRTHSGGSACDISIREDIHGNIYWSGVREEPCHSPQDLINYLAKGSLCRATGSTDMNAVSSRSHAIFSVILKQRFPDDEDGEKTVVSKFHFVDLAGSERLKRTKAQGDRAREGIAINSGLLALGNVISALGDESRRSTHIPYRDSKLTRLLQDSLGGNSQTLMMACISPSDSNFVETLSTLKYANRARNIKNKVSVNQEFAGSSVEVNQLRAQVAKLKMELNALRATAGVVGSSPGDSIKKDNEIEALRQEVNKLRDRVQVASDELCQVTAERDTLLLERELNSSGQDLPRLLEELMHADESGRKPTSLPIIEQYQKTIKDLRNELADTQERLAFMEATRAPVMHALTMQSNLSPAPSAKPSSSSTLRRRRVRGPGNSLTTRGNHVTFKSSRSSKTPKSRKNLPPPPQPIRASTTDDSSVDIEQWLQDVMGSIKYPESDDIRNEVRDSISRARAEIERGMQVLEAFKPREEQGTADHKNQEYDLMDEDDLFAALQSNDNDFLFTSLEHEMLDDIENTSPPPDWHLDNNDEMHAGGGHSRQSSGGLTSTTDESEVAAMCQENPHLARIIQQVQSDIRVKEELVNQLEKCEHDYVELHKRFEHKLYSLKQEILALKRDRDRVMRRNSFSRNDAVAQRERQQLMEVKHAYEMKIKSLMIQLSEWQRKYAQTTSSSQASRNHNESIIRSLRVSVESLKMERRRLIKRSKEDKERSKEQMHAHQREIQQLRHKQQRDAERRRRLERENKQIQLMLQKRTDEVVLTNDKLNKLIHIVKKAVREGGVLDERLVSKCADLLHIGSALVASSNARLSSARKRRSNKKAYKASIQERAAKKKLLLDRALSQFIVGKQAVMEMEQLMAKREELSQKQEELLRERERSYYTSAAERYLDDERYEAVAAELAYLNERIRALQNDAAHEIMQEEEDDEFVDMDLQQQQQQQQQAMQKPAKRVTFADEVMGYNRKDLSDEWLDMDALEEKYSLPPNADPETAHEMALKLIQSLTLDEAEKIMEAMINDVASLKMEEYQREAHIMQLEKSMQDLQRTLTVMRDKAVQTAIENEKKIKRLEQGSRRSSLSTICVSDDNDSAIDLRVEEQYQQFGTIFDKIYSQGMIRTGSDRSGSPVPHTPKNASGSPILPPMRPQSLIDKPPSSPALAAAATRRNSMSSPDQFLQHLIQTGLLSPMVRQAPSAALKPFTRDITESSTSSTRSNDLRRRSSIQSDNISWSSHDSAPPHQKPIQLAQAAPTILSRRRARSLQQQQRPSPLVLNKQQRRFSLRELSLQQQQQHQPSPLQQQFVVPDSPTMRSPTPNGHNVFDRLATVHTKASQAKRASTPVPL